MSPATRVEITDVAMRDGFQMESRILPTHEKVAVGMLLIEAGVKRLEATSFVSPRAVPQLADAAEVVRQLRGRGARLAALTPNRRGALRAADAGVDEMVVFVSASQAHNRANLNRSIGESLKGLLEVADIAEERDVDLCGSVATAFGCPFQGDVPVEDVLRVLEAYARLGIVDVALGDTTGMATPRNIERLCDALDAEFPQFRLSLHLHNTRGLGLVNVMTGLQRGVTRFEASIGGLGGCPFATGATGNVCTEDLIYLLDELGLESGVRLDLLIEASRTVERLFERSLPGQVMKAGPRLAPHDCPDF